MSEPPLSPDIPMQPRSFLFLAITVAFSGWALGSKTPAAAPPGLAASQPSAPVFLQSMASASVAGLVPACGPMPVTPAVGSSAHPGVFALCSTNNLVDGVCSVFRRNRRCSAFDAQGDH